MLPNISLTVASGKVHWTSHGQSSFNNYPSSHMATAVYVPLAMVLSA